MTYKRAFNFFLFSGIGAILPLIGVYLKNDLNFSGTSIGLIVSTSPLFSFFAQIITGYLTDKTRLIRALISIFTTILLISLILLYKIRDFYIFFIVYGIYSLSSSSLILLNNIGIIEDESLQKFGKIRVFGSIGFLITAGITPFIIKEKRDLIFLLSIVSSLISIFFISAYPKRKKTHRKPKIKIKDIIIPGFWAVIGVTFLFQISYACLDTFLGILINKSGYSDYWIGIAWVIGVLSELPVMYFTEKIIKKIGVFNFILLGIIAGFIRWTGYYLTSSITVIILLQILHSFTFSALYNGGIYLSYKFFPEKLISVGQSLYDSFSRILGYFVGIITIGFIYENKGIKAVFLFSSIMAFVSLILFLSLKTFLNRQNLSKT